MLNVIMLLRIVNMLDVIMPSVIIASVSIPSDIMLYVNMLNVTSQNFIMVNVITLVAIC
jgi:hypothetical protein